MNLIIKNGIDIVENDRIGYMLRKYEYKFLNKIFSQNEINNAIQKFGQNFQKNNLSINFFAKRFAAKEAFSKCIETGIFSILKLNQISILNNKNGSPYIYFENNSEKIVVEFLEREINKKIFNLNFSLSLSDEKSYSIASIILNFSF